MTEEKKQQMTLELLEEADARQERPGESDDRTPVDPPEAPSREQAKDTQTPGPVRRKKRATKAEMDDRNRLVMMAAIKFQARHERLPTVGEIVAETGYSRRQVYSTTPYKRGKIARDLAKSTSETVSGMDLQVLAQEIWLILRAWNGKLIFLRGSRRSSDSGAY